MSISDDGFREIIDDLTIANKKLKRKLRVLQDELRMSSSESSSLAKAGQLFDVKILDLPVTKRKELEAILHQFATSIRNGQLSPDSDDKQRQQQHQFPFPLADESSAVHSNGHRGPAHADSGYSSLEQSEPASNGRVQSPCNNPAISSKDCFGSKHGTVGSSTFTPMSDPKLSYRPNQANAVKMKVVVSRLEALFIGSLSSIVGAGTLAHQPTSIDPTDEVEDKVATIDLTSTEEGNREAQILVNGQDIVVPLKPSADASDDGDSSRASSQRPTRLLDLDPKREQDLAANLQYIKHLSLPIRATTGASEADQSDWVYLNVLTNMSQIHSINVTQAFVRQAILQYSDQLELSIDGRRVRWRGGSKRTKLSTDDSASPVRDPASESPKLSDDLLDQHSELKQIGSAYGGHRPSRGRTAKRRRVGPRLAPLVLQSRGVDYRPLFLHDHSTMKMPPISSPPTSTSNDHTSSDGSSLTTTSIVTFSSCGRPTGLVDAIRGRQPVRGGITFFSGANFCTDIQGVDPKDLSLPVHPVADINCRPLGSDQAVDGEYEDQMDCLRYFRSRTPSLSSADLLSDNGPCLDIVVNYPAPSARPALPTDPFVASGLGGVTPDDHFLWQMRRAGTFGRREGYQVRLHPSPLPRPSMLPSLSHSSSSFRSYATLGGSAETGHGSGEVRGVPDTSSGSSEAYDPDPHPQHESFADPVIRYRGIDLGASVDGSDEAEAMALDLPDYFVSVTRAVPPHRS